MKVHTESDSQAEPIIVMTRVFDAPRELVWAAFTDPKHVMRWYGGHGFENPVCEMDVRPGGLWRHVMRTPDGNSFPLEFVFLEVVKPEKLVWQQTDHGKRPSSDHPTSIMTVTLEQAGKQTKWRLVARFNSFAERDRANSIGFATVISEGAEKFDVVVEELRRAA